MTAETRPRISSVVRTWTVISALLGTFIGTFIGGRYSIDGTGQIDGLRVS